MPSMLSYPRRLKSGHITCYLYRTYHVLTTARLCTLDRRGLVEDSLRERCGSSVARAVTSGLVNLIVGVIVCGSFDCSRYAGCSWLYHR